MHCKLQDLPVFLLDNEATLTEGPTLRLLVKAGEQHFPARSMSSRAAGAVIVFVK